MNIKKSITLLIPVIGVLCIQSCSTPKQISYFQDMTTVDGQRLVDAREIIVRPKDKISIIVNCKSPELTALFNLPYVTQRLGENSRSSIAPSAYSQGYVSGYTVDEHGYIDFPVLGELPVAGKTRDEIAAEVKRELRDQGQATDAVVTVDFMNLYYQVLGEVNNPGRYAIDKDAVTILDALGTAGDLTIYGRRDKVKVLRNEGGKVRTYELNLCSAEDVVSSPAYYIQQNDVIYVDPNDVRMRQSTVNGNNVRSTSFWISLTSLAASVTNTIVVLATRTSSN
jgi:polysaccharide biosynthesis/export protein